MNIWEQKLDLKKITWEGKNAQVLIWFDATSIFGNLRVKIILVSNHHRGAKMRLKKHVYAGNA